MSASSSPSSQELLRSLYNRRLLTQNEAASHPESYTSHPGSNGFDANMVMVLSVLLFALICSLALNSVARCALRCAGFVSRDENDNENDSDYYHVNVSGARLANTGVKKAALKTFPTVGYSAGLKLPGLDTECAICLSEFAPGERVRLLPKCNHGFHVRCIDKWLGSHSSCPTCRHCFIQTCEKIVGCSQAASTSLHEAVINMAPLAPEDMLHI